MGMTWERRMVVGDGRLQAPEHSGAHELHCRSETLLQGDPRVFPAVLAPAGGALSDLRSAGPETPLDERTAHNVAVDVVDAVSTGCSPSTPTSSPTRPRAAHRGCPASVRAAPLRDRVRSRSSDGIRRRTPRTGRFGLRPGAEFNCRAFK